ncbi:TRIM56 [Mytilus coruscus]|uniref:TRIM56 n=1 Tax=Mytilus coruscus TaxID=42192 RepID=A0A6J8A259_MYTCO|nr:TRIM56 [Mytilus coruscus]
MATGGCVKDELTCALCLEMYKEPRLLTCYHTFCKTCIQQLMEKGNVSCPLCRSVCKSVSLSDFPLNVYIQTQITFIKHASKCDLCEKEVNINSKCIECDQFLCENCSTFHLKIKSCKTHQVVEMIESNEKSNTPILKVKKDSYCDKHPDEILRFYCTLCELPVCRDCKHTSHEGHKSEDVHDRVQDARNWLEMLCKQIDLEISCYNNQRNSMVNLKDFVDKNVRCLDLLEQNLITLVKTKCTALKSEMKQLSEGTVKEVTNRKTEIDRNISQTKSKKNYIGQTLLHGSDSDILQCKSQLSAVPDLNLSSNFKHLELSMPLFFENASIQLPVPTLGYVQSGQLKLGMTVVLKHTFMCNVINKYISSICLSPLDPDIGLISFRHDNTVVGSKMENIIAYNSKGDVNEVFPIPSQFDIAVRGDRGLYYYEDIPSKVGQKECTGCIRIYKRGETTIESYPCQRPISLHLFGDGDLAILDVDLTFSRVKFPELVLLTCHLDKLCDINLVSPIKIACGDDDDLWIADPGSGYIVVFDKKCQLKFKFDPCEHLKLPNKFRPNGICMYRSFLNNAVIVDSMNNCVLTVSKDGKFCDIILDHRHALESPTCVACKRNILWVCDKKNRICVYEIKN